MTIQTIPINIPLRLYTRMERFAHLTHRSIESVLEQTLTATIPLWPRQLSPEMQTALLALETLDDSSLWQIATSMADPSWQLRLSELLAQNKMTPLSETEQTELTQLQLQADLLMLRKGYAFVLLKWRGHSLPSLAELETP
jgi:hypothetical protein